MAANSADVSSNDVTLAILAGGLGSRMGMPKALLAIDGQPILDYLLDHLGWTGPTMLVTSPGREHPPGWKRFSVEVQDPRPGGGPLRGILTALESIATPLLLVLTVDMPGIRLAHCKLMLDHLREDPQARCVMLRRVVKGAMRVEAFPCALRIAAKAVVSYRLALQRRSVYGLLEEPGFVSIEVPGNWDEQVWANLNYPSDLAEFEP